MADGASAWWGGVLYQVYLRSFADTDGDGVGDLPGLIGRLDHLADLGVDGIWVSPVMPSPNEDWGYDVADYCAVAPELGTLADVDRLVSEAGARGISVVFDLVPNHTSDRHPWFLESRSSRSNAKRDWYVWADPGPDGGPPNNWVSNFFGPSWTLDPSSGQYYLHSFLDSQPDLNWWNPEIRSTFDEVLRFWFDRGIAGFRIDVCHKLIKDRALLDNPPATSADSVIERAWGQRELYNANRPETHDILRRWRAVADSYDVPRMLLGETYVLDVSTMAGYYGRGDELNLAFNIPFLWSSFQADALAGVVDATEAALPAGAWPVWNGSSHDVSRMATRWCGGHPDKIRCALMMVLTLRGSVVLYYGDEIGMPDGAVPLERSLDPLGRRMGGETPGRDIARTPMQWTDAPGAGFTNPAAEPWLPFGDATACNVDTQREDPASVYALCRELIALRRQSADLRTGFYMRLPAPPGVWAWRRGEATLIALNLAAEPVRLQQAGGVVRIGTRRDRNGEELRGSLALGPWEGVVVEERA